MRSRPKTREICPSPAASPSAARIPRARHSSRPGSTSSGGSASAISSPTSGSPRSSSTGWRRSTGPPSSRPVGRGVYWQWICWLSRANREAKPTSSAYNFGCAKLFISVDKPGRVFQSGLQIERGQAVGRRSTPAPCWRTTGTGTDSWHRPAEGPRSRTSSGVSLSRGLRHRGRRLRPLNADRRASWKGAAALRAAARRATPGRWLPSSSTTPCRSRGRVVHGSRARAGHLGTFTEVLGVMNAAMQVPWPQRALDVAPCAELSWHHAQDRRARCQFRRAAGACCRRHGVDRRPRPYPRGSRVPAPSSPTTACRATPRDASATPCGRSSASARGWPSASAPGRPRSACGGPCSPASSPWITCPPRV